MPVITCIFGLVLCGLSGFTYSRLEEQQRTFGTWLIPAGFGIVLLALGLLAHFQANARKHAMHAAVMVGLIGTLMCLGRGLSQLPKLFRGEEINSLAFGMIWSMAVVCLTFVGVCVQSFVAARKARKAAEAQQTPASPS